MNASKNILIAVDDSEASSRTVTYAATIIGKQEGFYVHLFHVTFLPPVLLEFGGSECPTVEEREEAEMQEARDQWLEKEKRAIQLVFDKAKSILHTAGISYQAVETHFVVASSESDVVTNILDAARAKACGTVVVGRESFSRLRELFYTHIGDEVVRRGKD